MNSWFLYLLNIFACKARPFKYDTSDPNFTLLSTTILDDVVNDDAGNGEGEVVEMREVAFGGFFVFTACYFGSHCIGGGQCSQYW